MGHQPPHPLNQLSLSFSHAFLLFCQVAGFSSQLSLLQAHFRINAGGVLRRAGGSPTCHCLTPHLSPWLSAWEKPLPMHPAFVALVGWSGGAISPEIHSALTLWVAETRLGVTCGFPNSWFFLFQGSLLTSSGGLRGELYISVSVCRTGVGISAAAGDREEGGSGPTWETPPHPPLSPPSGALLVHPFLHLPRALCPVSSGTAGPVHTLTSTSRGQ